MKAGTFFDTQGETKIVVSASQKVGIYTQWACFFGLKHKSKKEQCPVLCRDLWTVNRSWNIDVEGTHMYFSLDTYTQSPPADTSIVETAKERQRHAE